MLRALLTQLFARRREEPADVLAQGVRALAESRLGEAEQRFRAVLARQPEHADARHLLGHVLLRQKRFEESAAALRSLLASAPGRAEAWFMLGEAARAQGRLEEACDAFGQAIALDPASIPARIGRGVALLAQERLDDAEADFRALIDATPAFAPAHHNLGNVLHRAGRIDEAIAAYGRAVELDPGFVSAHSNLVYALNFSPAWTPARVYEAHREWCRRHAEPLRAQIRTHGNERVTGRRLRIGYLSPNFREHPVAAFFEPALKHHDRERFSIALYSDVARPDARTARLQGYGDEWRDIAGFDDAAVAARVRADAIDILVDLTGHTDGHRLLVFARKPAPVQVTWNGYANTTGLDTVDYRITDRYADPAGAADGWHSERLVRLPEIYMAFDPPPGAPEVAPAPALARGFVTFGSFNALAKVTPQVIAVWARLLHAVPAARLMMLTVPEGRGRERVTRAFAEHGVPASRLTLAGRLGFDAFLAAFEDADIALDSFPFAGTTTTCQTLWMGVPVVTLAGASHAGRVGVSMLTNVGLADLVARDEEDYVAVAAKLAADPARTAALRAGMRERMLASPLTDGARLARAVENAYRTMWEDYCRAPEERST